MMSYDKLKEQKILVTGASGLIGSSLIDRLLALNTEKNYCLHVTALVRNREKAVRRFEEDLKREDFALLVGDVCDVETFQSSSWDYVIHGAGNAHPKAFTMQPVETMTANLIGTMNLLEYACRQKKEHPVKKMIFLSSGEVYGEAPLPDEKGWTENTAGVVDSLQKRACYPESKRAAETLCLSYYHEYGIPVLIARLAYIYGERVLSGNTRADVQFLKKALAGEDIVMKSEGKQLRSYCYIQDAVEALLLLLLEGESGEAYNVANAKSVVTIREYADTLSDIFHVGVKMELPDKSEQSGYSKMQREVLNAEKLYRLGWQPAYGLRAGMEKMREALKETKTIYG